MKIRSVEVHEAAMLQSWLTASVGANPMSEYAAYRDSRSSWFGRMTVAVVEIAMEEGRGGRRPQTVSPS